MLGRRGLATLFFVGAVAWSGRVEAQYFRADPTVRATGGYNYSKIVSDEPGSVPVDQSGPLVTFGPSLALTYDTPRVSQQLNLTGTLTLPLATNFTLVNRAPAYNVRLQYTGHVPLDALTQLTLTGGFTVAPVNSFTSLQDPTLTPLDAPPADTSYNFTLSAIETIRRELSPDTSLTQTANFLYNLPFNTDPIRPSTVTLKNSLALSRRWTLDTLSLTGEATVTRFGPGETNQGVTDPRTQVHNDLVVTWRRTFTEALTGTAHLGASVTVSPASTQLVTWAPDGGALINYTFPPVVITLMYSYAAVVNVYTASTNLNNQVSLRAALPFGTTGLSYSSSAGYTRSVPIGGVGFAFDAFTADGGFTYTPNPVPKLSFGLRGIIARQVPLLNPLGGVTRYGILFNIGYSYPSTQATTSAARITPTIPTGNLEGDVPAGQEFTVPEGPAPADTPTDAAGPAAPATPPEPEPTPAPAPTP